MTKTALATKTEGRKHPILKLTDTPRVQQLRKEFAEYVSRPLPELGPQAKQLRWKQKYAHLHRTEAQKRHMASTDPAAFSKWLKEMKEAEEEEPRPSRGPGRPEGINRTRGTDRIDPELADAGSIVHAAHGSADGEIQRKTKMIPIDRNPMEQSDNRAQFNLSIKRYAEGEQQVYEVLYDHFCTGLGYGEVATKRGLSKDAVSSLCRKFLDYTKALHKPGSFGNKLLNGGMNKADLRRVGSKLHSTYLDNALRKKAFQAGDPKLRELIEDMNRGSDDAEDVWNLVMTLGGGIQETRHEVMVGLLGDLNVKVDGEDLKGAATPSMTLEEAGPFFRRELLQAKADLIAQVLDALDIKDEVVDVQEDGSGRMIVHFGTDREPLEII